MRVFLPSTLTALASAHRGGELPAVTAYAVTSSLTTWCGTEDLEELEYAALGQAARASLALLAADAQAPRRRVVVAFDLEGVELAPGEPGAVRLEGPVPLSKAAAVHVDGADAEPDVTAAAGGEEERAEDHELLWFALQEVPGLVHGL